MTVIAQQQSKRTGQWLRTRRVREDHYVTELLHETGTWWEVPAGAADNRHDAVANLRQLVHAIRPLSDADADDVVGFAIARPPSH
jgi:hypothetical protein